MFYPAANVVSFFLSCSFPRLLEKKRIKKTCSRPVGQNPSRPTREPAARDFARFSRELQFPARRPEAEARTAPRIIPRPPLTTTGFLSAGTCSHRRTFDSLIHHFQDELPNKITFLSTPPARDHVPKAFGTREKPGPRVSPLQQLKQPSEAAVFVWKGSP